VPAFELPPGLTEADTIGIIFDETDGLNCKVPVRPANYARTNRAASPR